MVLLRLGNRRVVVVDGRTQRKAGEYPPRLPRTKLKLPLRSLQYALTMSSMCTDSSSQENPR